MEEIKNCPFCGKKGIFREFMCLDKHWVVSCRNKKCFIKPSTFLHLPSCKTKAQAIRRWNKRK